MFEMGGTSKCLLAGLRLRAFAASDHKNLSTKKERQAFSFPLFLDQEVFHACNHSHCVADWVGLRCLKIRG